MIELLLGFYWLCMLNLHDSGLIKLVRLQIGKSCCRLSCKLCFMVIHCIKKKIFAEPINYLRISLWYGIYSFLNYYMKKIPSLFFIIILKKIHSPFFLSFLTFSCYPLFFLFWEFCSLLLKFTFKYFFFWVKFPLNIYFITQ
jgi:hypothetical protein